MRWLMPDWLTPTRGSEAPHALPPREAFQQARTAATKGLEIDEKLPEAHTSLAMLSMDDWDWPETERQFKRAIELNPNY